MKNFIKNTIVILLTIIIAPALKISAAELPANEFLKYDIVYHWGPIWKSAASAELLLYDNGDLKQAQLNARTCPWADRIYRVRDTLKSAMHPQLYKPHKYIKASNEGKSSGTDIINFSYNGDTVIAHSIRIRPGKKDNEYVMEAFETAYDMLSVFFYIRTFDYSAMKPNQEIKTTIISGRSKEWLKIRYIGRENINLRDNSKHESVHLQLTFSTKNQQNSSAPIDAWLDANGSHIPLMLRGTLSIGEVRVFYCGN